MVSLISVCSGLTCSVIYYAQSSDSISLSLTWWQYLLIAIVPSIIGFVLELFIDILKNRDVISDEDAKELKDDLDEIKDKVEDVTSDKDKETPDK